MKKNIYPLLTIFLLIFLSINHTSAQKVDNTTAKQLMSNYEFVKAIAIYNDYFNLHSPSDDDIRNVVSCYLMINETKQAKEWIARLATKENALSKDVLMYAHLLKTEALYDEAIIQYQRYKTMEPLDEKSNYWIESCNNSKVWMQNPEYFNVSNVDVLNSENSDFGLVPFNDGFIFTSDRKKGSILNNDDTYGWTGNPYLKLINVAKSSKMEDFKVINPLNDKYHNGPGMYNEKYSQFFFTRTKMVRVTKKNKNIDPTSWIVNIEDPDYENRLEIYFSEYKNGRWASPIPFQYNNPKEYSIGHPALSPDGKTLYFVSDMPGGFGGTDIYFSTRGTNGIWGKPVNLGEKINTSGKEMFPYIDTNGDLYFSSDGHLGMGGLDIFKSSGEKNKWSEPVNLKYPLNSPKDDFSLVYTEEGKSGYLSSNRDGGKGSDDIYRFDFNPPTELIISVITKTYDENKNIVLLDKVDIKIENTTEKEEVEELKVVNGQFFAQIKCKDAYVITGTKDGYYTYTKNIVTECKKRQDTVFVEMIFDKIEIDKPIVLKNIYYDFDKSFIRTDAMPDLDKVVQIMNDNPDIIVELGSHTDSRGSDDYNIALSQRRADAAIAYIISKGIDKNRIKAKGYGETQHLNECSNGVECSEEAHQLNRRTEFKVTGFIKGKNTTIKSDL